jgi:hypothetical protein
MLWRRAGCAAPACGANPMSASYHLNLAGLNLGIVLRTLFGVGTTRGLQDYLSTLLNSLLNVSSRLGRLPAVLRYRAESLAFSEATHPTFNSRRHESLSKGC